MQKLWHKGAIATAIVDKEPGEPQSRGHKTSPWLHAQQITPGLGGIAVTGFALGEVSDDRVSLADSTGAGNHNAGIGIDACITPSQNNFTWGAIEPQRHQQYPHHRPHDEGGAGRIRN